MDRESATEFGVAQLDGLLEIAYAPDPDLDVEAEGALRRLQAASPVLLHIGKGRGEISIMPDAAPFAFRVGESPSAALLPEVRELVETLRRRTECRVESTLRIQEFIGDRVIEGVFVYREPDGMTIAARERPAQPGERPELPELPLGERAESIVRKYQWPLVCLAALIAVLGLLGYLLGWWGMGAGSVEGPSIDAGPLEGIVKFEEVKWRKDEVVFEVRPGDRFDELDAVAAKCSLRPGVFRVILNKEGSPTGAILPLDLTDLPERVRDLGGDDAVEITVPYKGGAFDEVLICR